jgi:outer membrane protein OmpA-like peptidoglycan-associated protein
MRRVTVAALCAWGLAAALAAGCATKQERPAPPPEPECRRLDRASGVYQEVECSGADADEDGLDDAADLCPQAPESANGVEDLDGCPDPDADGDQVRDEEDDCPHQAGRPPIGCPEADADGDGLADHLDSCPDASEDFNGVEDRDGCPDGADVLVVARKDTIYIKQPIHFLTKSAMLLPDSKAMLDRLAEQLKPHQERIARIRVVGHADRGEAKRRKLAKLSKTRARMVARYLVYQGIDKSLFETESRGAKQPVSKRRKKRDRERNQRVELLVTLDAAVVASAPGGATTPSGGQPSSGAEPAGSTEPVGSAEPAGRTEPAGSAEPAGSPEPAGSTEPDDPGGAIAGTGQPVPPTQQPKAVGEVEPYDEGEEWDSEFLEDDWDAKFLEK